METDAIIRDSGKLCSRLFDHRHVINPEIHQFVNEFETKKAKRENQNLDASLGAVTEMTQTQLPNTALLIDDGAPKLIGSLQVREGCSSQVMTVCGKLGMFRLSLTDDIE